MSYIGRQPQIGNFQICDAISTVNNQAAYTMQVGSVNVLPETANHMIVSLNGVIQAPISSYTVSGSTITFAANLVTGDVINFIQILGDVLDLGVPSDDTVTTAKVVDGAITSAKLASGVGGVAGITSSANATAMTITSAEKIGIGETSPLGLVHIKTADTGASASADGDELIIENGTSSGTSGLSILSATNGYGAINFGDSGDNNIGMIDYEHSTNKLRLHTNGSQRLHIGSDGSHIVYTTPPMKTFDFGSTSTVTLGNNTFIEFTSTSGIWFVTEQSQTGASAILIAGGGQAAVASQIGSTYTNDSSSGTFRFFRQSGGGYRFKNDQGNTCVFGICHMSLRNSA